MKVKITNDAKRYLTIAEMEKAREIVRDMREYDDTPKDDARSAARIAAGVNDDFEILKCDASIAKNCRVWEAFGEGSGTLDIWVDIYAYNGYHGFFEIGVYLTDIWRIGGEDDEIIKKKMYINGFSRDGHITY